MTIMENNIRASFRDPSGFVFIKDGEIYRQVNNSYREEYELLMKSGLYKKLTDTQKLISHKEDNINLALTKEVYKIIKPEKLNFISYPYEWCFSQLKDAALLTLNIQKQALKYNMSLKDSSSYNIQFFKGKPIFIDTLSFEKYQEGTPWVAYKQFCQHFLAPLVLMCHKDARLNCLLKNYIDGIPLDLTSNLLPVRAFLNPNILIHIYFHSKAQKKYEGNHKIDPSKLNTFNKNSFMGLIDSLENTIKSLKLNLQDTEWGEYYTFTNYSDNAFETKKKIISKFMDNINPETLWDLGANTGLFSRIASGRGIKTIAFDIDYLAIEKSYKEIKTNKDEHILPLLLDLSNPPPGIGWANDERSSLEQRGPVDTIMALALIHHIAISNNVPLIKIAEYFSRLAKNLIIEFVPKSDSQVKKLLSTRLDIFPDYNEEGFESAFLEYFQIIEKIKINNTERTLYLMKERIV